MQLASCSKKVELCGYSLRTRPQAEIRTPIHILNVLYVSVKSRGDIYIYIHIYMCVYYTNKYVY